MGEGGEFCTSCGARRASGARFCTACGAPLEALASAPGAPRGIPWAAVLAGIVLVAAGAAATWSAFRTSTDVPRAVPGKPAASAGAAVEAGADGLPSGHPSIELPKEVTDFLDGLTAEADKNPQSVDALQKLARARYRASVINASYRVSAEQALQKLLALDPANAEGLRISANLAYDGGDFAEAEKRFVAYLAKEPGDAGAITDLGSSQLFQNRAEEAVATYRRALEKDPKFMQAHFNLGIALGRLGKKDESLASLRSASQAATTPEERQHIENAIAELEGRPPAKIAGAGTGATPPKGAGPHAGAAAEAQREAATGGSVPGGSMQGGMPMPPPAPERPVPTNASTDFHRAAEKLFVTHPMVGPRVVSFEWKGSASLRARIADFPMDQMPPFARAKFRSGMAAKLNAAAADNRVTGPVLVELVDDASGSVMETLDSSAASEQAPGAAPPAGKGAP